LIAVERQRGSCGFTSATIAWLRLVDHQIAQRRGTPTSAGHSANTAASVMLRDEFFRHD
jgi:hypothetical protein